MSSAKGEIKSKAAEAKDEGKLKLTNSLPTSTDKFIY